MGEILICICANLFRIYIVYRFFKVFFGKARTDIKVEVLAYGIYFVVNTWLYMGYYLAWLNIINSLAGILLLSFLYTKSIRKGVFIGSLIYVVNMICDIVSTLSFVSYQDGKNTSQVLFVICDLLFLIFELATEKIVDIREEEEHQNLPLILVPICSVVILWFMSYSTNAPGKEVIIVGSGLLFINFLILYLYNILLETLSKSHENEIAARNASMYLHQLNMIKQNEEKMSALRHDMRHHLMELKILAENGDNSGIQKYIDNMKAYIQDTETLVFSGNTDVDSLLNFILKEAKEKLRVVDITVQLPPEIPNSFDINVVVGNLLENAVEAAEKTEEKIVRGSIILKKGVLRIQLENSYNGVLVQDKHGFRTTKRNKESHGIGLKSVKNILEKYNGAMEVAEGDRKSVV